VSKDLHVLQGWSDGSRTYSSGDAVSVPASGLVLTAVWKAKTLAVEVGDLDAVVGEAEEVKVAVTSYPTGADYTVTVTCDDEKVEVTQKDGKTFVTASEAGDYTVVVTVTAAGYPTVVEEVSFHAKTASDFDWVPWVVMAIGVLLIFLGLVRCFPALLIPGALLIGLGAVDVLGIFNTFWWWERWQETSPKRRRSQSWPPYCCCRRRSYSTPRKARGRTSSTWSTGPGRRPCRSWRPPPWSSRIPTCSSGPMSTWPLGASRPRCT
jgi:hypothetical protein